MGFAVLGEHLRVGSGVSVEVSAPSATMFVGVDPSGAVPIGTVAGDDDLELVRIGDVILFDRPVQPVRLVDAATVESDPAAAAAEIAQRTPGSSAVVDRDVGLPEQPDPNASLEVRTVDYGTDRITVQAETDRAALLVVSQAYYPGWTAVVDGTETEVVVAEAAFLGVPVGPGSHEIELTFRPRHLGRSALFLSFGCLVVALLLIDAVRRGDLRSSDRSAG